MSIVLSTRSSVLRLITCAAVVYGASCAAVTANAGTVYDFSISYSDSGLGVSGSGVVQGIDVGGGEFDLISGYLNATLPGVGTFHETLVYSPSNPSTAVFSNANGDNFVYDNRIFVPAGGPDGAQLSYAGGIVFQTALPSKEDVYLSAYYAGSNNPTIYYFGGWDRPSGALGQFTITNDGPTATNNGNAVSTPEPGSILILSLGLASVLGLRWMRKKRETKVAAV
jgi:hypothetical protein